MFNICADAHRGQKRASDPLVLELQAVLSHLPWVLYRHVLPVPDGVLYLKETARSRGKSLRATPISRPLGTQSSSVSFQPE